MLESDIISRLESDFADDHFPNAVKLLADSGISGRVARCVVVAAAGSLDELRRQIETASTDYRDAILAGEYDGKGMSQVRDLRTSFLIDDPLDFWIGELAVFLHSHDFHLISLESQNATVGPFEYSWDHGEGVATFRRGDRTLTISRNDKKWSVIGEADELERFQLHVHYEDQDQFRNQLAWMCRDLSKADKAK